MKILKWIAIVIAIIIAIPLLVALFTTKDYKVEQEITINKPNADVFNYVKMLRNQVYYSKWAKMDPNAKVDYTGTDGTVGFIAAWDSENKKVGKGEQQITAIADGSRMDVSLHFLKPFEGMGNGYFTTEAVSPGQTKVKWGMYGKMSYPLNFMLVIMDMNKTLGPELATGLTNLKDVLEK